MTDFQIGNNLHCKTQLFLFCCMKLNEIRCPCPLQFFDLKSKESRWTLIYLLYTTVKYSSCSVYGIRGQFSDNPCFSFINTKKQRKQNELKQWTKRPWCFPNHCATSKSGFNLCKCVLCFAPYFCFLLENKKRRAAESSCALHTQEIHFTSSWIPACYEELPEIYKETIFRL